MAPETDLDSSVASLNHSVSFTPYNTKLPSKYKEKLTQRKKEKKSAEEKARLEIDRERERIIREYQEAMDSYKFDNYPTMIPKMWLTDKEASTLGYSPEINYDNAISKIEWNQPLIAFSISNVKKDKYDYHNILSIRLDGPLMRIRMIYYNLVLASCSTFPLFTSGVCLLTEVSYIIFVLVTVCRYRHQKNWFVILSRVNVSLAIVVINLTATYIGLTQDRTPTGIKEVNSILQLICVVIIVVCIVLELVLMTCTGVYTTSVFLWYQISVCRKRIQKR